MLPTDALPSQDGWHIASPLAVKVLLKSGRRCLCGERLRGHLRCAGCKALVGPYHATTKLNRDGLCRSCAATKGRRERR